MPTIFITRELDPDSPIHHWAAAHGVTTVARSLLRFTALPFRAPKRADVWFFYSSRAVEHSIAAVEDVAKLPRLAALGPGTAATLEAHGFPAHFIGSGDPVDVSRQFTESIPPGVVFFPRARQSRKSVQRMLPDAYTIIDAVCYDNVAVPDARPVVADVYVFTSPLNVEAYVGRHDIRATAHVIAIGPSTGKALTERGLTFQTCQEPTEASIIDCVSQLLDLPTHSRE